MKSSVRFSHFFFWATLVAVVVFNLETPFLTILFSFLALKHFAIGGKKWISVTLFLILVYAIFQGFVTSLNHSFKVLPSIVAQALPKIKEVADSYGYELPVSDLDSVREA